MDEKISKAFEVANYMATLSNQRRVILEEFNQQLLYYKNGATFKINQELIVFVKTMIDLGQLEDVAFLDANNFPVLIQDVKAFFDDITVIYFQAINQYAIKFAEIKSKRKVADLIDL
jgi:hypothetical protein